MAARKGQATPGAGRKKGGKNKATLLREARAKKGLLSAINTGVMPLEVMLHRMRGTQVVSDEAFQAAVAAAPYCHPKLASLDNKHQNPDGTPLKSRPPIINLVAVTVSRGTDD